MNKPCKYAVNNSGDCWECRVWKDTYCAMAVKALSQSEPQKGKWVTISDGYVDVVKCDQCGKIADDISNYCPNCGADMREEQE